MIQLVVRFIRMKCFMFTRRSCMVYSYLISMVTCVTLTIFEAKRLKNDEDHMKMWHCRLGHIGIKRMEKLHKDGLLESLDFGSLDTCEPCLMGKMTRTPFNGIMERADVLLGIIHTDVCGPMNVPTRNGLRYFVTFTDDLSRYGYIYLMKHKSETFEKFKEFQNEVENQLGKKIKPLRSDRGGEYLSHEFAII